MKTLAIVLLAFLLELVLFTVTPSWHESRAAEIAVLSVTDYGASMVEMQKLRIAIMMLQFIQVLLAGVMIIGVLHMLSKSKLLTLVIPLILVVLVGCAPKTDYVIVEPNETAFAVANDSDTAGAQVDRSQSYWVDKLDLRTNIPVSRSWRNTGGFLNLEGIWVPSVTVITVSTMEVSREWNRVNVADDPNTTVREDDSYGVFGVESIDSQGISIGAVITARVLPENAALYLANFGTVETTEQFPTEKQGRSLGDVLDGIVRDRLQQILDREYGMRTINDAQNNKAVIWDIARDELSEYAITQGISILVLGGLDGLVYDNNEIQMAIDQSYIREEQQNAAVAGATQTAIYNGALIGSSNAAATATVIAGRAAADVQRMQAQALAENPDSVYLEAVRRWNGILPQIMDSDSVLPYMPPSQLSTPIAPTSTLVVTPASQ